MCVYKYINSWLFLFFRGLSCSLLAEQGPQSDESCDVNEPKGDSDQLVPPSAASTLSTGSQCTETSTNSSICSEDHSLSEYEIVKSVLFSTRENVNVVHETFRQVGTLFTDRTFYSQKKKL